MQAVCRRLSHQHIRQSPAQIGCFKSLYPISDPFNGVENPRLASTLTTKGVGHLVFKGTGGRSSVSGIGATGFLGRYLVQQLAKMGSQVLVPFRGSEDSHRHLKLMGDLGQIVPMKYNPRDENSVKAKANVVINLIGKEYETRNYSFEDHMAEQLAVPYSIILARKMSEKSKLKVVASSDESSHEENADGSDDLGLSLDKLNLGPKKKLLILCLGGLLVKRVHLKEKATVRGLNPDVIYGKFWVFKRPFCTEFLKFCFERFDVALWSSAKEHNIDGVLSDISGGAQSKFVFVWSQKECTNSLFPSPDNKEKPLFLKELKDLWKKSSYKEKYTAKNTLLIDHEPHTALLNPPNTAIFPQPYNKHNPKDTVLGEDGELRKYLDGVADAEDVPSYVKEHPFEQSAITPSHPKWDFYARVVRSFNKKKEKAGTSKK